MAVAELVEHFQWMAPEESRALSSKKRAGVKEELAEVFLHLASIADKLDVGLWDVVRHKILINKEKYSSERLKCKSLKYDEYEDRRSFGAACEWSRQGTARWF
ncbi:MAG: MazG-like family protein [Acidihalobacter sp.]|uniref:MazG-like family protein n=1 Tax=Acidihalobacter sp. TaxID=1872108 RepID=UPI00307EDD75